MDHTRRFMELLGNPEKNIKVIHVAGTNGKGSTCAYMSAMLCSQGENVGLFTSPHLIEMTERICINGQPISSEQFVETFLEVMDVVELLKAEGLPHPTFFEFLFGMAMKTFAREEVTYAVLETGLGGRLDATNVIERPVATVITSIGLDHEMYLGSTISEIAGEKAGIIKPLIPVFYDGTVQEASLVIEQKAKEQGCKCKKIADCAFEIIEKTEKYIAFYIKDAYDKTITSEQEGVMTRLIQWKIRNTGSYQVYNASLAITTLMAIVEEPHRYYEKWKKALEEVVWQGRMEEVAKGVFLDGAHNVAALEALAQDRKEVDVILFSAVADKNYREMIKVVTSKIVSKVYIVITIDDARGVPAAELAQLIEQEVDRPVYIRDTVEEAWALLNETKSEHGKALCLGSLYLVGMLKQSCENK